MTSPSSVTSSPSIVSSSMLNPSGMVRHEVRRPSIQRATDVATVVVRVPQNATVYIDDVRMKSTGALRRYQRSGLRSGQMVTFHLRAETIVDGKKLVATDSVRVRAGDESSTTLDPTPIETTLTIRVPADASVYMDKKLRVGFGNDRHFATQRIAAGERIVDYPVRVTIMRNGEILTQERLLTLGAGESKVVDFQFNTDLRVAALR